MVEGLKYAKSHEWAKVEGDVATVGVSDHAQVSGCVFVLLERLEEKGWMQAAVFALSFSTHTRCQHAQQHQQAELGDVVYVELPEVGKELAQGDAFGVVESVKVWGGSLCVCLLMCVCDSEE